MTLTELRDLCQNNGLPVNADELERIERFANLLIDWNQKINLISRKDEENVLGRHILHSLTLRMPAVCDYEFNGKRAADVGTGGGLPGIPLRIVTPELEITLIDSIQKKIAADNDMIARLGLSTIRAIAGRAEEIARQPEHSARYDVIVSRAVAPLEDLLKWTRGLLKPHGTLFSLKGGDLAAEVERAKRLSYVKTVDVRPLTLRGYDAFEKEEKKLVRVELQ